MSEIDGFLAMEVAHQILEKISKSTSILKQNSDNYPMAEPTSLED